MIFVFDLEQGENGEKDGNNIHGHPDIQDAARMIKTYTYTAKMSSACHRNLEEFLVQATILWNCALQERIGAYKKHGMSISYLNQQRSLTQIREEDEWFSKFHLSSQRTCLIRLDKAFKRFFSGVKKGEKPGFPRFKSRNREIKSFETSQFRIHKAGPWRCIRIKGIGKFRFKGKLKGEAKLLRIVKTPIRVKIQLVCELPDVEVEDTREALGIDAGVLNRITLSNGVQVSKREVDRTKIKSLQRKVSRSVKGSNNRKKKVLSLNKEWQRIREKDKGYLHELTSSLIKKHSSKFYVEDLKVRNMTVAGGSRKTGLNRSILDQTWGDFNEMLSYKAASAGGFVSRVSSKFTSQVCSSCGYKPKERIGLSVRMYKCQACGYKEDRDVNAAINVLCVGLNGTLGGMPEAQEEGRLKAFTRMPTAQNSMPDHSFG